MKFMIMLFATLAVAAVASEQEDACGATLCLAGEMTGDSGGSECSGYIQRYFSIVERHHGNFSPSRTAAKRIDFLQQCPSGDSSTQKQVNDRYGTQRGL
jgi:hypothetical protein